MIRSLLVCLILTSSFWFKMDQVCAQSSLYEVENGYASFKSEAPLEIIEARSRTLKGIINTSKRTFAFTIPISSFQGFNNPLQKNHFNENYLESRRHPNAIFKGKIIENVDLSQPGEYVIRAKGKFSIHGVEQERIIKSKVLVTTDEIKITSFFSVLLKEHRIKVPRIVHQKIAEEIFVQVKATLKRRSL